MNTITLTNHEMEMVNGGVTADQVVDIVSAATAVAGGVIVVTGAPVIVSAFVASVAIHCAFLTMADIFWF